MGQYLLLLIITAGGAYAAHSAVLTLLSPPSDRQRPAHRAVAVILHAVTVAIALYVVSDRVWAVNALAWAAAAGLAAAMLLRVGKQQGARLAGAAGADRPDASAVMLVSVLFMGGWALCGLASAVSVFLAPL